jgi:predicted metal-dependent peptidase
MKPNRRYGFLYMGSRYDFTTRLLVAVDVSGSMNTEDIARGFSLINQFFTYGVPSIDVIQFDTELKGPPVTLKRARCAHVVQGRGGTNFTPVIDFIDAQRDYDGVIVFTDGYAPVPRPPQNRRTRILWLFNSEATYRVMHARLQAIGRAAFLKETAGYRKG